MNRQDRNALLKAGMAGYDEDGFLRVNGADIRSDKDERDYTVIELESNAAKFLDEVITPRTELVAMGQLDLFTGQPMEVWPLELQQRYIALRNSARMLRPDVMARIKRNRDSER